MALYRNIAGSSVGLFIEPATGLYYGLPSGEPSMYDTPIIDYASVPATTAPPPGTINTTLPDVTVTDTGAVTPAVTPAITIPPPEQKTDWLPLIALAAAVAIAVKGESIVPGNEKLFFAGSIGLLYYASITHHG